MNKDVYQNEEIVLQCLNCGASITKYSKSGLCSKCQSITTRKVDRPNREDLKKLIRNYPFTTLAQKFNVSDNAIRKWCKAEGLPSSSYQIKKMSDEEWSKI